MQNFILFTSSQCYTTDCRHPNEVLATPQNLLTVVAVSYLLTFPFFFVSKSISVRGGRLCQLNFTYIQRPCSPISEFIYFIYTSYLLLSPDIVSTCLFPLHRTAAKQSLKALFFRNTDWPRASTLCVRAHVMSFQSRLRDTLVYSIYGLSKRRNAAAQGAGRPREVRLYPLVLVIMQLPVGYVGQVRWI